MQTNVNIKKLKENAIIPKYATGGSAALDLCACIENDIIIEPGKRALIPTGLAIAPSSSDIVALICARSGLAHKNGICLSNGIGVIDSDYRGELLVSLFNTSDTAFKVSYGDRIAQIMFMPVYLTSLVEVSDLSETSRGEGGFGSTGTK